MTTLRAIFTAFAPASLERSPPLPTAHRQAISAIQQCHSGQDGPSLSPCQSCGGHHRVQRAWGNRHCPQCQQHTTPQGLQPHLDQQLPGPPCLITFPVPETLRPFLRSPQRIASQALLHASLQRPASGGPQTSASSGPTSRGFAASCLPGAGNSSTTLLSTPSCLVVASPRTARPGAPPSQRLCPRQSPLPHLPRALQRRHAPSGCWSRSTHWSGPSTWNVHSQANPTATVLQLPRPLCLQGRHRQPPPRQPHGPHRHLHLPDSGQYTPTHHQPRRSCVYPQVPPACLASTAA